MRFKFAIVFIVVSALIVAACTTLKKRIPPKTSPSYVGIDVKAQAYVDEWIALSKQNNITFTNKVTVGFTKITQGSVIGTCSYAKTFREIDLDTEFFVNASELRKKALIFHELTHCYCTRGHDFGKGLNYPDDALGVFLQNIKSKIPWCLVKVPPGFLDDNCPSSIMHPVILDHSCLEKHWTYYMTEMFDRCEPF